MLWNQLDKYEFRIAEVLEKEVKGKQLCWWNSISKNTRKKRVRWFEGKLIEERNEGNINFDTEKSDIWNRPHFCLLRT
jgi:hypothetical protein